MQCLREIAGKRPEVQVIQFRHNRGQTAAIQAGIDYCRGNVIITCDSDLQNDPVDIPRLLEKLDEGYDLVSGWRRDRQDARIRRTFISRVANWIISQMSGVPLRDYGCTLKVYRREVISGTHRLYGEMHRFIPIYASWAGAKIAEIEVKHHARRHGQSSYGLERVFKVILDLIVVLFIQKYFEKPIYIFGGVGIATILLGIIAFVWMVYLKLVKGISLISTPLPLASSMFILVGVVSLLLGLLAEIMIRIYYESQDRRTYAIRSHLNGPNQ
jgi:dolichol-phosphate mannosyltransferase